jgi:hypothetical protein
MADMHPLVIVLLAVLGSVAVIAIGCAIHRVLRPEEFGKPNTDPIGQDQLNYMREVCDRTRGDAFADGGRGNGGGYHGGHSGAYNGGYDDGYSGVGYSNYSRV